MCKCNPSIKTPYCGVGDCVWPNKKQDNFIQPEGQVTNFDPAEKIRTYYFGKEGYIYPLIFNNVTKLTVRPSGSHRLETKEGKRYIVPEGWLYIELDIEGWTK